ncbi:putative protease [Renibacterium salmoninarum ATCC 33209]|uniref:Putative protease n=1 Tax=Renibacterium salmoninarum (strain ATCC 33209 / DSM 20767 / JCM 11484 / NBRC 15589 / NCIMB 2235) TaxID=288705 RepID=A9WLH1_RENSM|nr:CPBP family intramembrane glutamic endopeptidase [Renibacterium salmoninarum]ABY21931.1 putative protease [Renibacterium salmoninarum ATCC 33209]
MKQTTAPSLASKHPLLLGAAIMVSWQLVVYGLGSVPFSSPAWFPGLGALLVNAVGAAVVLGIGAWLRLLPRSALGLGSLRRYWWLAPLVAVDLSYGLISTNGVPGIAGTPELLLSSAGALVAVGISEELAGRGVGLAAAEPAGRWKAAIVLAAVFGLGHLGNWLLFGSSLEDALWQVFTAGAAGFCWGAGRFLLNSIWPLAFVHALNDWMQINSPGAAPLYFQIAIAVFNISWGALMLTSANRPRIRH